MQVVHAIATSRTDFMGVTTALRAIAAGQAAIGLDVTVVAVGGWPCDGRETFAVRECGNRDLRGELARSSADAVIHSHVPWRLPALAPLLVRRARRRFVHSPHGSFAPAAWDTRRWRKTLAWRALFRRGVGRHDLLIANSAAEAADVARLGLRPRVIDVPHPLVVPDGVGDVATVHRTVAFLGRLHPIKGVLELVEAWGALGSERAGWTLRLSGPEEDPAYVSALRRAIASTPDVELRGPVGGDARYGYLAAAEIAAVPSRSENFCYVVGEALAMGTPVLTTAGVPWPEIERDDLGWRAPDLGAGLRDALRRALAASPAERAAKGARGRRFVRGALGPEPIARRYAEAYREAGGSA